MKASKGIHSSLGLLGIVLCAACCALPIFGAMLGVGTLSILSKYFEWAGIAAIVLSVVFFVIYMTRRKKPAQQDGGCRCKTDSTLSESKVE